MKKTIGLFAALTAMFFMSTDVYSSSEETNKNRNLIKYCVYQPTGFCVPSYWGDVCYLVDKECNWIDDTDQPDA